MMKASDKILGNHCYLPSDLLLHRYDMLFIDEVIAWGDDWIECKIKLNMNGVFTNSDGETPAWLGLEYMSQSIAAMEGIRCLQHGLDITMSFIIGAKKVKSDVAFFESEHVLRTRVSVFMRDDTGIGVYDCSVFNNTGTLMTAQIKGAMPRDPNTVLNRARHSGRKG